MKNLVRWSLSTVTVGALATGLALSGGVSASAYQPTPSSVYTATDPGSCNKSPCILYPKSTQLPSGRLLAAFEDSQGAVVGQDMPIFKSDDYGDTWQKLADLRAPAYVTDDPAYSPYTSNWTNPYLYVLPEDLGSYKKGTVILSTVVSPGTSTDNNRLASAVVLWASTNDGASWGLVSKVAASPTSYTGVEGDSVWQDPVWEPYLMMRNGKLIVFYSDERDALGYDATTGVARFDPADASSADSGGQILAHTTWDGVGAWTAPIVDVAGLTQPHDGKTKIGGGRPGMTNIVPTTDGKWLLTYEYWGGGDNVRYKIADDPENFRSVGGAEGLPISQLPVAAGSQGLAQGGSPVLVRRPDGGLIYNAANSGAVWVNESGRSDGAWKQYQTTVPAGYSRALQYVEGTGRIQILQAPWGTGPVSTASLDLGHSEGAYYSLVNRATGQVLSTAQDKTQDPVYTGDQPDIITWSDNPGNDTQRWHVQRKGSSVTFLNKAGGRALGIWFGNATAGQPLSQWVDDNGSDKLWTLVPTADGYTKIQSTKNTGLFLSGTAAGDQVRLASSIDASTNTTADDAQEWQLVQEAPTASGLSAARQSTTLIGVDDLPAGSTLALNAATADPAGTKTNAGVTGRVWALTGAGAAVDLGTVAFDANERGSVAVPSTFAASSDVRIAVAFDASALVWDSVRISAATATYPSTTVASSRCVAGKAVLSVTTTNTGSTPMAVTLTSAYGSKSFAQVAPGANASSAFSTRLTTMPAGEATASVGPVGSAPSRTATVAYTARAC
ncbi:MULTISPECIES: RICIN domain-containing protein [unclassified Rathayibacter]|uniref:RICIN domain-containing protein n=1 Tax=unclassified Rathayibacter TaxID=2609250 RepID=UPI0010E81672|nr:MULTISPECIES: RICIN domain-containing protein [unclassified Rathayibacter]TCL79477.1 ricin-type beta-trefoil lectin protein [Rathayibacter sp. PhB192]TCM25254.1 ricin-type beta-trefoil lectin protein [Rathayibacter sp. PhB179]